MSAVSPNNQLKIILCRRSIRGGALICHPSEALPNPSLILLNQPVHQLMLFSLYITDSVVQLVLAGEGTFPSALGFFIFPMG